MEDGQIDNRVGALRRIVCAGAVVIALSGLLLACGDGDDQQQRLSTEQYIRRADAACARINTKYPPPPPETTPAATIRAGELEIKARTELLDGLEQLNPPQALQAEVDAYLTASRQIIHGFRDRTDAVRSGAPQARFIAADQRVGIEQNKRGKLGARIGFKVCSAPPNGKTELGDPGLVAKADAICSRVNRTLVATVPARPDETRAALVATRALLAAEEAAALALEQLDAPPSYRDAFADFVDVVRERIALTRRQVAALEDGDSAEVTRLGERQSELANGEEWALTVGELGFEVCGAAGANGL